MPICNSNSQVYLEPSQIWNRVSDGFDGERDVLSLLHLAGGQLLHEPRWGLHDSPEHSQVALFVVVAVVVVVVGVRSDGKIKRNTIEGNSG